MPVASLILGIIGLIFCWNPVGWVCGILALIFGILGIKKHNKAVKDGGVGPGKGMAIAGVVLSLVTLITTTIVVMVVMAAVGAVAHAAKKVADDPTGAAANAIVSSAEIGSKIAQDPRAQALAVDALKAGAEVGAKVAQDPRAQALAVDALKASAQVAAKFAGADDTDGMTVTGDPDEWFEAKTKEYSHGMTKDDQFILLALYKTILKRKVSGEARETILSWCQDNTTDSHMRGTGLHKWALASVAWAKMIPEKGVPQQK